MQSCFTLIFASTSTFFRSPSKHLSKSLLYRACLLILFPLILIGATAYGVKLLSYQPLESKRQNSVRYNDIDRRANSSKTISLDKKGAIILFTKTNRDSANTWFTLNSITINLDPPDHIYQVTIPITIQQKLPKGHADWKCTYAFGSENNQPNSCLSSNDKFFNDNAFHIKVPASTFTNKGSNNTEDIFCKITVNFIFWNTYNNRWFNWDYYDLLVRLDYRKLINVATPQNIIATALLETIIYQIVSKITVTNGEITNTETKQFKFRFAKLINNYQVTQPVNMIVPVGIDLKTLGGFLTLPKQDYFGFKNANLDFSLANDNIYHSNFRDLDYYDLLKRENFNSNPSHHQCFISKGLVFNYLQPTHCVITLSIFVSTFVNTQFSFLLTCDLASIFEANTANSYQKFKFTDNQKPPNQIYRHKHYDYAEIQKILHNHE